MPALKLILQIAALVCFFISWMAWSLPKSRPWYWLAGGFFFLLLSWMLGGFAAELHTVG